MNETIDYLLSRVKILENENEELKNRLLDYEVLIASLKDELEYSNEKLRPTNEKQPTEYIELEQPKVSIDTPKNQIENNYRKNNPMEKINRDFRIGAVVFSLLLILIIIIGSAVRSGKEGGTLMPTSTSLRPIPTTPLIPAP